MRTHSMTKILPLLSVALAALAGAGCSLLVNFDPEGKPCGAGDVCRTGFTCSPEGTCVKSTATGDGGTVTPDAGTVTDECGGKCTAAQKCLKTQKRCAEGCDALVCAAGAVCAKGSSACAPAPDKSIGSRCLVDTECPAGLPASGINPAKPSFCLISSVNVDEAGGKRYGFCIQRCDTDADCKATPSGVACFDLTGSDSVPVKLCLRALDPAATAAAGNAAAVLPCRTDAECAERGGTCAVFDQKTTSLPEINAPMLLCDLPRVAGLPALAPCDPASGTSANGICPPGHKVSAAVPPVVSQPCRSDSDCPGRTCISNTEFAQPGFLPRLLDLCGAKEAPRSCVDDSARCGTDADCSPNLPHCFDAKPGKKRCMAECAILAGKTFACDAAVPPASTNCMAASATLSLCVKGGSCGVQ